MAFLSSHNYPGLSCEICFEKQNKRCISVGTSEDIFAMTCQLCLRYIKFSDDTCHTTYNV